MAKGIAFYRKMKSESPDEFETVREEYENSKCSDFCAKHAIGKSSARSLFGGKRFSRNKKPNPPKEDEHRAYREELRKCNEMTVPEIKEDIDPYYLGLR